jgi:hypothetical protein
MQCYKAQELLPGSVHGLLSRVTADISKRLLVLEAPARVAFTYSLRQAIPISASCVPEGKTAHGKTKEVTEAYFHTDPILKYSLGLFV